MTHKSKSFFSITLLIAGLILLLSGNLLLIADEHIPRRAVDAYDRGMRDLSRDNYSSAERNFKRSLEEYPDYFPALKELGKLKAMMFFHNLQRDPGYKGEEGNEAVKYLSRASELKSEDHEVLMFLSQIHTMGYLEDLQLAKEFVMRALDVEQDDINIYDYALSLMDPQTDLGYMLAIYEGLIRLEPDNLDNLVQYFSIAHAVNDIDKMILALEKILEVRGENLEDMRNLAVLYIQSRNKEKALEFFPALERAGGDDNYDILNVITQGYIQFGEYKRAYDTIKKLYDISPDDYTVLYSYGFILESLDRKDEAIPKYQRLAKSPANTPNKNQALISLINIHLDKEDYQEAHDYCIVYIEEYPDDRLVNTVRKFKISSLVYLHLEKEDFPNVIKYCNQFIEQFPNDELTEEIREIKKEVESALN